GRRDRRAARDGRRRPPGAQEETRQVMSAGTDAGVVRLCAIRESALSVDEVMAAVADPGAGGIVLFTGVVRDHDDASHHEGHHGENFGHGPEEGVRREAGRREGAAASPPPAEAEDARPAERATTP